MPPANLPAESLIPPQPALTTPATGPSPVLQTGRTPADSVQDLEPGPSRDLGKRKSATVRPFQSFVAIDTERANSLSGSIIQVGCVHVKDGRVIEAVDSLVHYGGWFDPYAKKLHKIHPKQLKNAPSITQIYWQLYALAKETPLFVHHGGTEPESFAYIAKKYRLPALPCRWIDTHPLTLKTWKDFQNGGGGLSKMSKLLEMPPVKSHTALGDAQVCAQVFQAILAHNPTLDPKRKPFPIGTVPVELRPKTSR